MTGPTEQPQGTLTGFAKGFGLTFGTMFKHVYTQQYPFVTIPVAPRYHGRHVLNRHPDGLEKCVGCELCAWACPADAIYVEGGDNTDAARYSPGERDRPEDPERDRLAQRNLPVVQLPGGEDQRVTHGDAQPRRRFR